jgi:mannitol-specific phosphotransferase system IIBC component
MIICHKGLSKMVRKRVPGAVVVAFTMFLNDPAIDRVVSALANGTEIHEEG